MWYILLVVGMFLFSGCASVDRLAQTMNERGWNGCYEFALALGYPLSGASGSVRGYFGTGDNKVTDCIGILTGRTVGNGLRLKQCSGEQCTNIEIE